MRCPIDGSELVMSERQGIKIDYCSKCRGVWLDRGELDEIIERSGGGAMPHQEPREHHVSPLRDQPYQQPYQRKRRSFLGEIFDFD